ncbi:uncharacterized protein C1orf131 homolog isoform X2 [Cavia porcellus]|uniref:uncharacterized protein C1orf131 homolog isoform X2 n=1 Tax=Cavia porcellus TaxID=10141 RepID=UPI002FDFCA44
MAPERGSEPGCSVHESTEKLLDTLLQTLYDVGEKEGETGQKKIRKKRENRKTEGVAVAVAEDKTPHGSFTKKQKKSVSSFFRELREELNHASVITSHNPPSGAKVPTAAGSPSPLQNHKEQVEVVEFHSRNKKRKPKPDQDECIKTKTSVHEKDADIQEFNLEKPPKNSYVNYKVLQNQLKEKKAAQEEEKRVARDADIFKKRRRGQEDRKSKKKRTAPSILSSGRVGQVGKFKNGTLILSPFDIKKINSSRVPK